MSILYKAIIWDYDNLDQYFDTLEKAIEQCEEWKKDGHTRLRVYKIMEDDNEEYLGEECVYTDDENEEIVLNYKE